MRKYIEENIIPRYDAFDAAHRRDHVIYVIEQSLELARHYDVNGLTCKVPCLSYPKIL